MSFKRLTCFFVFLAICPLFSVGQSPPPDWAELEGVVNEELKTTKVPGAAVAIVKGGQVVFSKGFGLANVETGEQITPNHLFRLGSSSKMFTGAALATLAHQGKLKLDAPIGTYVSGLHPKLAALTSHQLLTHTAGIIDEAPMFGKHDDDAMGKEIRTWNESHFFAQPGQVYSYSNPGYWLAGLVIEEITKKPFADAVKELVFQPLGMKRTTYRPLMAMTYPLALGHDTFAGGEPTVIRPMADNSASWPAGSIFSSANDLSRFAIAMLNDGQIDGKSAIEPEVVRKICAKHVATPGGRNHYGYGLIVGEFRGVQIVEHAGARSGHASVIRFLPNEKAAMILIVNKSAGRLSQSLNKATEMLAKFQPDQRPQREEKQLTEAELARAAGKYVNHRQSIELIAHDGKLHMKMGRSESALKYFGDDRFGGPMGEIILVKGATGDDLFISIGGRALRKV